MSTHSITVFQLGEFNKHPDADKLAITKIGDTDYSYVLNIEDWKDKQNNKTLVAWIQPDTLVPVSRPEFSFLGADAKYNEDSTKDKNNGVYALIRAKRLREVISYGLLVPVPQEITEPGEYPLDILGCFHYEPPVEGQGGNTRGQEVSPPPISHIHKYDVENFLKYGKRCFSEGELLYISIKMNGANARYTFIKDQFYCGSRTGWKKEFCDPPQLSVEELISKGVDLARAEEIYQTKVLNHKPTKNLWWKAIEKLPQVQEWCNKFPGWVLYGEVYGQVQKGYNYGLPQGEVSFAAFDILDESGKWLDSEDFLSMCYDWNIPTVPVLHRDLPFQNCEQLVEIAENLGNIPESKTNHEGIVVAPVKEKWIDRVGRVKFKIVSSGFKG